LDERARDSRESYTHREQCRDMAALLDHINESSAVFIGHDWGGAVVWHMSRRFPHRVKAVASLCTM
jgi:soluble epoxide hydrolase/lipid-phosphate phosphatase